MKDNNTVIPNKEFSPKRLYHRIETSILCFKIVKNIKSADGPNFITDTKPLFIISCQEEEDAKALMDDLYYGEYTGS